jgi:hypothetical protein
MRIRRARSDAIAQSPRGERRGIQIGPRIRVGGTLGKIGQKVKIGAGKVLANPVVDTALAFVPGVGPGVAAGARALGTALDTSHGSVGLGTIAKNGIEQYALNKAATSIPGMFGKGKSVTDILRDATSMGGGSGSAPGGVAGSGGVAQTVAQSAPPTGVFGKLGAFAKNNKDLLVAGGSIANSILENNANNAANRIRERQVALDEQAYADAKKREEEQQARLDPVRQLLMAWLSQRLGQPGAMGQPGVA